MTSSLDQQTIARHLSMEGRSTEAIRQKLMATLGLDGVACCTVTK
jgi:hypothetical protein